MLNTIAKHVVPEWYLATSAGQSALKEERARCHAERQALVEERNLLCRQRPELIEKHETALTPLRIAAEAARKRAMAAEAKLLEAQRQRNNDLYQNETAARKLERELIASADPRIDSARRKMNQRFDERNHKLGRSDTELTGLFNMTGKPDIHRLTNGYAIVRLVEAIKVARRQFDDLALQNPDDLVAAIDAIEAPVEAAWVAAETGPLERVGAA